MNPKTEQRVVEKAKRLLPYGFTAKGAVTACLYYFRQPTSDVVVNKLAAHVEAKP